MPSGRLKSFRTRFNIQHFPKGSSKGVLGTFGATFKIHSNAYLCGHGRGMRPAPAELPQAGNRARVGGCSGATSRCLFFMHLHFSIKKAPLLSQLPSLWTMNTALPLSTRPGVAGRHRLSTVDYRLSTVDCGLSTVDYRLFKNLFSVRWYNPKFLVLHSNTNPQKIK